MTKMPMPMAMIQMDSVKVANACEEYLNKHYGRVPLACERWIVEEKLRLSKIKDGWFTKTNRYTLEEAAEQAVKNLDRPRRRAKYLQPSSPRRDIERRGSAWVHLAEDILKMAENSDTVWLTEKSVSFLF